MRLDSGKDLSWLAHRYVLQQIGEGSIACRIACLTRMKIIDKINQATEGGQPFYSFEFFPPKTAAGVENL